MHALTSALDAGECSKNSGL